jgi:xanthine dehydrogenase/oxidase
MGSLEESVVEIGGNGIGAAVMRSLQEEEEEASASPPQQPIVYVNGKRHVLPSDSAHRTLLEYLRGIGLTGTKLGCGEGGCGACTVMLSHYDTQQQTIVHRAINACLAPLYSVEGMHVVTVEGIGNRRNGLHPVQVCV